jgi:hypothetical protein
MCQAARGLITHNQRALGLTLLKQAISGSDDAVRACAVQQFITASQQPAAPAPKPVSHCDAGGELLKNGQVAEAKSEYETALSDGSTRSCAVAGLHTVAKRQAADKRITASDVLNAVSDTFLNVAWPWLALLLIIRVAGAAFRFVMPPSQISVRSSADDKDFATAVLQAANAADSGPTRTLKVVTVDDASLPDNTVADLSKVLGLPGSVPLQAIVDLVAGSLLANRLQVSAAVDAGWATAHLQLRRPWWQVDETRIAIRLGDSPATDAKKVLAHVAGAWLVALEAEDSFPPPTQIDTPAALLAQALFRAGSYLQSAGDNTSALACYEAMPKVTPAQAPVAWAGARLNIARLLGIERLAESAALMDDVVGALTGLVPVHRDSSVRAHVEQLRLQALYLRACLWVNAEAKDRGAGETRENANRSVAALGAALAHTQPLERGAEAAMRLIGVTHAIIVDGVSNNDASKQVEYILSEDLSDASVHPTPPLTPAAHYDAACAHSLLAGRVPHDETQRAQQIALSVKHLKIAFAATPPSQKARVTSMAQTDPTLTAVRGYSPSSPEPTDTTYEKFNDAVGVAPPAAPTEESVLLSFADGQRLTVALGLSGA